MAYQSKDLSVLAYANGFTSWHYRTSDDAGEVLKPGYFNGASDLIRWGDMVMVNCIDGGFCGGGILIVTTSNLGSVTTQAVSPFVSKPVATPVSSVAA